ncbi:hypothetical protein BDP27DRAFT_1328119, partial [Rhodocollybia butyracea]
MEFLNTAEYIMKRFFLFSTSAFFLSICYLPGVYAISRTSEPNFVLFIVLFACILVHVMCLLKVSLPLKNPELYHKLYSIAWIFAQVQFIVTVAFTFASNGVPILACRGGFEYGFQDSGMLDILVILYITAGRFWIAHRRYTSIIGLPTIWCSWSGFPYV